MDLKKIGSFFKLLRQEKGLTQEQLAEQFNVSNRTVSRWETGRNMPDIGVLIEIADFYNLDIRELLDGERKNEKMDKDLEEVALKVADYDSEEKKTVLKKLHCFSWIGAICSFIFLILDAIEYIHSDIGKNIAYFCLGLAYAMLILGIILTSKYIYKIREFKMKILKWNK